MKKSRYTEKQIIGILKQHETVLVVVGFLLLCIFLQKMQEIYTLQKHE